MTGPVYKVGGMKRMGDSGSGNHRPDQNAPDQQVLRKIERERDHFHHVLHQRAPVMLHSIDAKGHLLSVSEHWLKTLGYKEDEVLGRRFVDFMTAASRRDAETEGLPRFYRYGYLENFPYQLISKDGRIVEVLLTAHAELDSDGSYDFSVAFLKDVTQENQALRDAKRAAEVKSEFISMVSHELRTPITSLGAALTLLREVTSVGRDPQTEGLLEISNNSIQRITALANDLLDLEKMIGGVLKMEFKDVELTNLVEETLESTRLYGRERDIEIVLTRRPPEPLHIRADPSRVGQVLDNLLSNAVRCAPDRSRVEVGVANNAGGAVISVADRGPGIPEDLRDCVFEPFAFRDINAHQKSGRQGTGLGLTIAQAITKEHGGTLTFETETDKGTTFFVSLPAG